MLRIHALFRMIPCCLLLIAAAAHAQPANDRQPIVTSDLLRIRTASAIDVSRDGSTAVVAVRSIAEKPSEKDSEGGAPKYAYRSHLFLLDLAERNGGPRQMTFGDRNDTAPVLSPNGRFVAFVRGDEASGDDENNSSQIWIMPTDGGEAMEVTNLEHGASSPQWSPDGRLLLFASSIPMDELDGTPPWPMERPQRTWNDIELAESQQPRPDGTREEIRAWLEANAKNQSATVVTRIDFQGERRLKGPMRFRHLFTLDWRDENAQPQRITDGFFDHNDAHFTPDSRSILYVAAKDAERHPDRVRTSDVWMIDVDGANDRMILRVPGEPGWRVRSPRPSHDGSVVAFLAQNQDEPTFRQWQIGMATIEGENDEPPIWLTDESTFDFSVRSLQWQPARMSLLFTAPVHGGFPLMTISPGLIRPEPIIDHDNGVPIGVQQFAAGGGAVVYAQTTPTNPNVLRVRFPAAAGDGRGDRLLMDLNEWVHDRKLSMPHPAWMRRPDGRRLQFWVMMPIDHEPGKKYPTVLQIHGGPSAMWGPGELSMWHEFQLLCSWGYGVVYANPRGSGGYGYQYQRANFQDWGEGPAGDVLAALDRAMIDGWIDPDRLLITGGSYAGYLTAWIIAHDHRFKAAVAQRGVYHLPTFFGEGNAWRLLGFAMGGLPFEARAVEVIRRESPFTHVHKTRTPLLIMHGSNDLRTGVSQSEMLYRALKAMDRPVEYIRYPRADHNLSRTGDPHQRMDRLNRIIEFFERHIDNPREAPTLREE